MARWPFHAVGRTQPSLLRKGFGQTGQDDRGTQPGQPLNGSESWTAASSGSLEDETFNYHSWCHSKSLAPWRRKRVVEYDQHGL